MMKTVVSVLIFLTLFSINIFASDYPRQKAVITDAPVGSIAFSPDGNTIAGGGWHAIPVDGHWLNLVVCQPSVAGYSLLSLMRASSVVNRHLTVARC